MSLDVRVTNTLLDNIYKVRIESENFSQSDIDLMTKFGEPEIDTGGTFDSGGPNEFILPTALRKVQSGFPVLITFDDDDPIDAGAQAGIWATEILSRITTEMGLLRLNSDGFTGETVTTV